MQFSTVASVLFALASGVMATPAPSPADLEPFRLHARTCFTLKGKPLELCQGACKAACAITPPGLIQTACDKACEAGPLKAREPEPLLGAACSKACSVLPNADLKAKCQSACKRDLEAVDGEADDEADETSALEAREPITGGQVCRGACAVTCNSTVLALAQKKCLQICNGKCPSD